MRFIPKQSQIELEVGDLVEYSFSREIVRGIIVQDGDGYRFMILDGFELTLGSWGRFDDLLEALENCDSLRIIKSLNLEIREI